jgi:glutathione peroxidase-family protein
MHDFSMKSITGEQVPLSQFEGGLSLVVNLASQ